MAATGYSGTPLAKKLGIMEGSVLAVYGAPVAYRQLFSDWPEGVDIVPDKSVPKDLVHFFVTKAEVLHREFPQLKTEIKQNGAIWISWPKKASGVGTDITEDVVRVLALETGLVDIKVCAVDNVWSGLKLVIPVKDRM